MELTTHVKKYRIFSRVFDIANQLLTRHLLSRHSVRLRDERRSFHYSQSKIVCRKFLWIMAAKTLKNQYRLQTVTFKLS